MRFLWKSWALTQFGISDMTDISGAEFDPLFGEWNVSHKRLVQPFVGSSDWQEFDGTSLTQPLMGGAGNVEDNLINFPDGAFRAVTLRTYDPSSKKWAIWWCDGRNPHAIDAPIIGEFTNGIGVFYADRVIAGKSVKVRMYWQNTTPDVPHWEQALSADAGKSWETIWTMDFRRK